MSNGIPADWVQAKVGDLATVKRGASPRPIQDPKWWGGNVGWVRISDVTSSQKYLMKTTQYLSEEGVGKSVRIEKGEVVLSICATIGRPIIIKVDACIHDGFVWFDKLKSSIDREYWYYFLASKEEYFSSQRQSGTQGNLNTSIVADLDCLLPPLPEQQKIATILTSVDTVIEKTRAQIDKLKHLKTAMMQELLTKGIGHTEFKDSPAEKIPKSWKVVQFKEVFTLNYGKSPKEIITENGANIVWGTGGETAKTNNFLYEGESIVLGRKGTIDQPRYVTGKFWVIDTAYYSSNHGENNVRFLHYALQIKNLKALNEASGVPSLSRDTLYAEWLALPDPLEQKEISKILHSIEVKIAAINKKLSSFEKNKKALMQDLLTGTIRV